MVSIRHCSVQFSESFSLRQIDWQIDASQHWAIVGGNGSGKSALAALLAGEGEVKSGKIVVTPDNVRLVSFETQRKLIERERQRDDSDITDEVFEGTSVDELLHEVLPDDCLDETRLGQLIEIFQLQSLLSHGFRSLSTGETRKVMLIRALVSQPDLLVLDEPFDGLDADSVLALKNILIKLVERTPIVFVMNRLSEIPDYVSHLAYMDSGRLDHVVDRNNEEAYRDLQQLLHLKTTDLSIPKADPGESLPVLDPGQPLVRMRDLRVAYGDNVVFDHLDWQVNAGQHWQITGPNGSGKTCLLNLVTGDHPQCYVNDIFVFGYQRGHGESIWEIKQHIGYVSTALQWEYRVSISLRNVIISGFYDSIGLYQSATDGQKLIADDWLRLLGMNERADQPFNQLSYGDQRLLLIARAMVKHPHMLILDEPCLGLDDVNRQLVLALIEKICVASETTVIYVNHHSEDRIPGIENTLSLRGIPRPDTSDREI
ncbi:MAG TPA: molybdate ABC transporter ATP-binding protein ModF [Gammaproteobacteria bacterium]|nr:molybdate ABC transporter ATP-binding protein ModF [Gammaproteobacteria bacterium]